MQLDKIITATHHSVDHDLTGIVCKLKIPVKRKTYCFFIFYAIAQLAHLFTHENGIKLSLTVSG